MPHRRFRGLLLVVFSVVLSLTGCEDLFENPMPAGPDATRPPGGDVGRPDGGGADTSGAADAGPGWATVIESPGSMYVGAFRELAVELHPSATYTFDDIEFSVPAGSAGGSFSSSRDDGFSASQPTIMFLGGWKPGDYTIEAHVGTQKVSETSFRITTQWSDRTQGPPLWTQGDTRGEFGRGGFAFGGGADSVQSYDDIRDQTGNRHMLMLFVDFDNATYPTAAADIQAMKDRWMAHAVGGVNDPSSGLTRSVSTYWEEVSGGRLTMTAETFGPVRLTGDMAEWFGEKNWKTEMGQAAVTAALEVDDDGDGSPDLDLSDVDSIVFVTPTLQLPALPSCSPTNGGDEVCDGKDNDCDGDIDAFDSDIEECAADPICGDGFVDIGEACDDGNDFSWDYCTDKCEARMQHFPWPTASGATYTIADSQQKSFAIVKMPDQWTALDGRAVVETLAHEIGHNLGLPDLYAKDGHARPVNGWSLMAWDAPFNHVSVSERLALGWIDESEIFAFNPASTPLSTVILSPIETLRNGGTSGYAAVEARIAEGWNYYFEYRQGQADQIADRSNPVSQGVQPAGRVLVTDHMKNLDRSPEKRRMVTLGSVRPGFDGPALDVAQTFKRMDPQADMELQIDFIRGDRTSADLVVDYGVFKPDPSIRPWPSPGGRYQSADIEVRNAKNDPAQSDSAPWKNVPWAGNPNDVVATVRNLGTVDAPQASVHFFVKDFNVGGELPVTYLGTVTEDVPAGATTEFVYSGWVPPGDGHYCIQVEIELYQNSTTFEVEMTELNNFAQSNYTKFWSDSASPAKREGTMVTVRNPYDQPTVVFLDSEQTHDHFRTYLGSRWVLLNPGESRQIPVMFEYSEDFAALFQENQGDYNPVNRVRFSGWAVDPDLHMYEEHTPERLGGADVDVAAGFATAVQLEAIPPAGATELYISGVVRTLAAGQPSPEGTVLATIETEFVTRPTYARGSIGANGEFTIQTFVETGWESISVEYLGRNPWAPSSSREVTP